jgi:hypothetical protein
MFGAFLHDFILLAQPHRLLQFSFKLSVLLVGFGLALSLTFEFHFHIFLVDHSFLGQNLQNLLFEHFLLAEKVLYTGVRHVDVDIDHVVLLSGLHPLVIVALDQILIF